MYDCPKCKLSLQPQEYEGSTVLFCSVCWGHWLDDRSLAAILAKRDYGFSSDERDVAIADWVHIGDDDDHLAAHGLACPQCGQAMTEQPFSDDCPVLVDRCTNHGTWLDAGEIKKIQVFVEGRPR